MGFSVRGPMSGFDGRTPSDFDRLALNSSHNGVFEFNDDFQSPDQPGGIYSKAHKPKI
jgi:hypothetical protein